MYIRQNSPPCNCALSRGSYRCVDRVQEESEVRYFSDYAWIKIRKIRQVSHLDGRRITNAGSRSGTSTSVGEFDI